MQFQRPTGSQADVNELVYIATLHQTAETVRTDVTILEEDIQLFLSSRYGIKVSLDNVRNTIMKGLTAGGGTIHDELDASKMDIMELTAILLIPTLLKSYDIEVDNIELPKGIQKPPSNLISDVLHSIIQDITGEYDTTTSSTVQPPILNIELLRKIFIAYGEYELANNEQLLLDMIDCCKNNENESALVVDENNNNIPFNVQTFARGLTHDVDLYDIRGEVRMTTNKDDVLLSNLNSTIAAGMENHNRLSTSERNVLYTPTEIRERLTSSKYVESVFTFPALDNTAGTYRSRSLMVFLWACTLITYFAYSPGLINNTACNEEYEYVINSPWIDNTGAILCECVTSIFTWIILFIFLCIWGMLSIGFASIGNDVNCREWKWPAIGGIVVLLMTIPPYITSSEDNTSIETLYLMYISLILGFIVCGYHIGHIISLTIPKVEWIDNNYPNIRKRLNPHNIRSEGHVKHATAYKLNQLITNALRILKTDADKDTILTSNFGRALYAFSKPENHITETVGGFIWTWERIINKSIFRNEGIWYSVRLLASNICQAIVTLYILGGGINLTKYVIEEYDKENSKQQIGIFIEYILDNQVNDDLVNTMVTNTSSQFASFIASTSNSTNYYNALNCSDNTSNSRDIINNYCNTTSFGTTICNPDADVNYLCGLLFENNNNNTTLTSEEQMALLDASGFNSDMLRSSSRTILQQAADESVDALYPSSQYMISIPMVLGVIVAFAVAVNLTVNYIPSITSTILKLRSGVIQLQGNPKLRQYRVAPESVALLTGSLFWGALTASILTGGVFALIIFFFVWQVTAYLAQRFLAIVIGVIVITLIRLVVLIKCRVNFYEGFYRKRPGAANLSILALEWASFALSSGFIFVRMVKLLLVAGFAIGRIDRPFLAEGLGQIGPIELDAFPTIFLRDILANEAHRHPYIELLGTMYLMKLRFGDNFGKTAGSCWRLLFVYALMPWLHRYRISARPSLKRASTTMQFSQTLMGGHGTFFITGSTTRDKDDDESLTNQSLVAIEEAKIRALATRDGIAIPSKRSIFSDLDLSETDGTHDFALNRDELIRQLRLENSRLISKLETLSQREEEEKKIAKRDDSPNKEAHV